MWITCRLCQNCSQGYPQSALACSPGEGPGQKAKSPGFWMNPGLGIGQCSVRVEPVKRLTQPVRYTESDLLVREFTERAALRRTA